MRRVLLDENLPRKLKWSLNAEALTVPERGWGGIKNGRLLRLAAAQFDVLLTMDRGIEHQQNLSGIDLCLVVILIVLDTHVWIWWVSGSNTLTTDQKRALEAGATDRIGVSAISCWEVATLVEKSRLDLDRPSA